MRTYEQVLRQWETLWAIAPADDMTGGYVDQDDLYALLHSPSKTTARKCLESQIRYWFQAGPAKEDRMPTVAQIIQDNPAVREIAEDYGYV